MPTWSALLHKGLEFARLEMANGTEVGKALLKEMPSVSFDPAFPLLRSGVPPIPPFSALLNQSCPILVSTTSSLVTIIQAYDDSVGHVPTKPRQQPQYKNVCPPSGWLVAVLPFSKMAADPINQVADKTARKRMQARRTEA